MRECRQLRFIKKVQNSDRFLHLDPLPVRQGDLLAPTTDRNESFTTFHRWIHEAHVFAKFLPHNLALEFHLLAKVEG